MVADASGAEVSPGSAAGQWGVVRREHALGQTTWGSILG